MWGSTSEAPDVTRVDHHVVVAKHNLVKTILADQETFPPDNALDAATPIPVAAMRILTKHKFRLPPSLANNSTESHPMLRTMVADALHPRRVAAQRAWLTGVVRRRVATVTTRLRAGQQVDLYADLVADLPLLVLARLIALPNDDVKVVKEFSRAALELFWAPLSSDRQVVLSTIVGKYHARLRRFARTASGFVAALRSVVSEDRVVATLFFLLVAGQETTSQFLTLLLHRLVGEPRVLTALAKGSTNVDAVVEEGLRLVPPIVTWRRRVARDVTIAGYPFYAGESVVLWLEAAGRDKEIVTEPDVFVPGQAGSRRHLAFGAGPHRCLGAQLSRMEAAVVVAETAPLLRAVTIIRAPWCPDNLSFRMPDSFVVALRKAPSTP